MNTTTIEPELKSKEMRRRIVVRLFGQITSRSPPLPTAHQWTQIGFDDFLSKRRWFSQPSPREVEWKQITQHLLEMPVGSLNEESWDKAEEALNYWIQMHENGVNASVQLLDRLSREKKIHLKFNPLNDVIYNWKTAILERETLILPSKILAQIEAWRSKSSFTADFKTYTMVIEAAASYKKNHSEGVLLAQKILDWMLSKSNTHTMVRPTTVTFSLVMNAWATSGRPDAPRRVKDLLECLNRLHNEGWPNMQPNIIIYNILLNAYARSGKAEQARNLLEKLQKHGPINPDLTSFTTVLHAYARSGQPDAGSKAEKLLMYMQKLYSEGNVSVKPTVLSFTCVIGCWASHGNGEKAEELLKILEMFYKETNDADLRPDVACYNTVLQAWANANQPEQAERLLQRMYLEDICPQPGEASFNIVISAWAKCGAADQAEAILTRMHELSRGREEQLHCRPSVVTYNTVLDSWAKSKRKDAWTRAEAILHHMEQLSQAGENNVKPNVRTWNTVLNCMAKAGKVEEAHRFMQRFSDAWQKRLVEGPPNVRTWNTLLAACAAKGDLNSAKKVFERMKATCPPDIVSYNTLLKCCEQSQIQEAGANADLVFRQLLLDKTVSPNRISYLTLLLAWIKSGDLNKAEEILLEASSKRPPESDREHFHQVLTAWSEAKSPKRAEALLLKMVELYEAGIDIKPNVNTYNRVLDCWAKSQIKESGERADTILRHMENMAQAGDADAKPNKISYNSVLNAWANSRDPTAVTRAEHLVLEMILKGDPDLIPDDITYGTWLKTIAMSNEDDKERRARGILKTMKIHKLEPSNNMKDKIASLSAQKVSRAKDSKA